MKMVKIKKIHKHYFGIIVKMSFSTVKFILEKGLEDFDKLFIDGEEYDYSIGLINPETFISFKDDNLSKSSKQIKMLKKQIDFLVKKNILNEKRMEMEIENMGKILELY